MSLVFLFIRLLLAFIFIMAGLVNLADRAGSRQALRDFGVPVGLAVPLGILLPLAEVVVAVGLVLVLTAWWAALAACVLLLLSVAGGVGNNLAFRRQSE